MNKIVFSKMYNKAAATFLIDNLENWTIFISFPIFHWKRIKVWFPANETFRKKMRKFSFAFHKLFCEISHFFAKINEAKNEAKMRKFRENHECYNCNNWFLKRTCAILCSDTSIFEVLLCHLYINLACLSVCLFVCLSVCIQ